LDVGSTCVGGVPLCVGWRGGGCVGLGMGVGVVCCVVIVFGRVMLGALEKDGPACVSMLIFCPSKNFPSGMLHSICSFVCGLVCPCQYFYDRSGMTRSSFL